jgi:hypothetical protein
MDKSCSTNGEKRNAYRMMMGKSEVKRPLEKPRRGWVDNVKMDIREIGWIEYGLVEGFCEHSNEPLGFTKSLEVLWLLHNWWLLKESSDP